MVDVLQVAALRDDALNLLNEPRHHVCKVTLKVLDGLLEKKTHVTHIREVYIQRVGLEVSEPVSLQEVPYCIVSFLNYTNHCDIIIY